VKALRLAQVNDIHDGNLFLPGFVEGFNGRFGVRAAKPDDLHRRLNMAPTHLDHILCHREQRYVGAQLTFHYDRKQIILERSELSEGLSERLSGRYVEIYDFPDRPVEVRWKGHALPYRVFNKDSVSATRP
jgi:hypothetical protein